MAARSVMLSGQYARRCSCGVGNVCVQPSPGNFVMPEYPAPGRPHLPDATLPECLRTVGYRNVAIGKWHIHSWPHDIGFDEYLIPRVHHCHTGQSYTRNGGPEFVPDGFSVDFEADEAAQFLRDRQRAREPFFLFYNISPPHCPVADAPQHYLSMYDPAHVELRPNVDPDRELPRQDQWFKIYRYDFRHYMLGLPYADELPERYGLRNLIAEYRGLTTWADDTIGKLLKSLDDQGLAENSIVLFTADHGDNLGSHNRVQKGSLNEESVRIPFIVCGPGVPAGRVIRDQVAGLVDLMPTLLEFAGVSVPSHVQGQSLTAVVSGARQTAAEPWTFIETGGDGIGVRTPTHLYALPWDAPGVSGSAPHYFHDMRTDPFQLRNMAGTDEQTDIARSLDTILRHWHQYTPGPDPSE